VAKSILRASTFRAVLAVALFVALAVAGAGLQNGNAQPTTKYYSTTVSGTAAAGARFAAGILLTNSSSSQQTLGSENVLLPVGYTVAPGATVSAPAGKSWTATLGSIQLPDGSHPVVQLRASTSGDALNPGQSVTVGATVTVPCTLPADTTWKTEAKQSNSFNGPPGNDFLSTTGTPNSPAPYYSLATPTTPAGACSYRFVTSSTDLSTWAPAAYYRAGAGFGVTVEAVDGAGNERTGFNGSATMSGLTGPAPNGANPTYATVGFNSGIATYTVTAVTPQSGATLTVTDSGDSTITATSASFQVYPGALGSLAIGNVADTAVGVAISPPVTVTAYDGYGNLESCPICSVNVTLGISLDGAGGGTTLGGGGPVPTDTSTGVSAFPAVTLSQSGSGFTLKATSGSITSPDSNPFIVYDAACGGANGSPYSSCSATKNNTSITTTYPTQTTNQTLIQLSGGSKSLTCGASTSTIGSLITWLPAASDTGGNVYTWQNPISVTLRWNKALVPGTGVSNFTLCLAKPVATAWGPANTYSVVKDCPSKLTKNTLLPCASRRNRDNAGDLIIVLLMGSGDPIAGLG
jgi:hypothetical protein